MMSGDVEAPDIPIRAIQVDHSSNWDFWLLPESKVKRDETTIFGFGFVFFASANDNKMKMGISHHKTKTKR
jgi:hypothetical protein